ncbi:alpha/beta hydrolase [Saccharospirillum sp. MSK14-1]|uniref:alpha/beta hydrolase n=1 Tax=Saccharospirillum sp. MSK14-1 TaxID=1897632 RepID=UPI001305067F|nr:alpha/beta hydrolase [Saccharospirillum sp. MSK14-1]
MISLFVATLVLSGCGLPALNLITPHSGYEREKDLAYGPLPRQRLDLYHPIDARADAPMLVFFYGGGWNSGDKEAYRFVAQALAEAGYAVAIPDYRLYPEVTFPAFVEDGAAALAWLENRLEDDQSMVLIGHSAGAHIAALLAMDERYAQTAGFDRQRLQSWVGLSGPYDFLPLTDELYINIFGAADGIPDSQPVTFASADDPPALLIYGNDDEVVGARSIDQLTARLLADDVPVTAHRYDGVNHIDTVASFSVRLRDRAPAFADTLEFLATQ